MWRVRWRQYSAIALSIILQDLTGLSREASGNLLERSGLSVKLALLMHCNNSSQRVTKSTYLGLTPLPQLKKIMVQFSALTTWVPFMEK